MTNNRKTLTIATILTAIIVTNIPIFANGGPFLVKYPEGDSSGKGVLARLDPDLKPMRETRLRVLRENLKVSFKSDERMAKAFARTAPEYVHPPLVEVSAEYTIENPTAEPIEVDFGFPILRGIYTPPYSMMAKPAVNVRLGDKVLGANIISNSVIYGIIRRRARQQIKESVAASPQLARLVNSVRSAKPNTLQGPRDALLRYLTNELKWGRRDAALMVEYAGLDLGTFTVHPIDRSPVSFMLSSKEFVTLVHENLGCLAAIGEQKATQFLAHLAGLFDPAKATQYEDIFKAWGGDVRDCAIDIDTGKILPREIDLTGVNMRALSRMGFTDPTIYARIDYFDENAKIPEAQKASCKAILKNLPVIFTFAPMNILHYRVRFEPNATEKLTVTYKQYAFADTKGPATFQLAYVVHPASLWDSFGPINLEVSVPSGVRFGASVPCKKTPTMSTVQIQAAVLPTAQDVYNGVVKDKTGQIFLAIERDSWKKKFQPNQKPSQQLARQTN